MSYQDIASGTTERFFTVVARASAAPITSGTVNYYLKAKSGTNAGKWWRDSDQTWQVAETANAMTHDADGHWEIDLASSPFDNNVRYLEYVKESGDLHVPDSRHLTGRATTAGAIQPYSASAPQRVNGTNLTAFQSEDAVSYTVTATDAAGNPIDLSGLTLRLRIEQSDDDGTDLQTVEDGDITVGGVSSNEWTFLLDAAVTGSVVTGGNKHRWALFDITGGKIEVLQWGRIEVKAAPVSG